MHETDKAVKIDESLFIPLFFKLQQDLGYHCPQHGKRFFSDSVNTAYTGDFRRRLNPGTGYAAGTGMVRQLSGSVRVKSDHHFLEIFMGSFLGKRSFKWNEG